MPHSDREPAQIIDTLKILPTHWRIVPVNSNKQPLGYYWQRHPFSPEQMIDCLAHRGYVSVLGSDNTPYHVTPAGIGLLCGQTSKEFLLAIDVDGISAMAFVEELSRGNGLPPTVAFTSGRPGRAQYLFSLTNGGFKYRKIAIAPGEALELRGEGHQSVLPPSPHPITGFYRWLNSPEETDVARAPNWVIDLLEHPLSPPQKSKRIPTPRPLPRTSPASICATTIEKARLLLEVIHPRYADNYESWIFIGMALKYISDSLLPDWDTWSQLSSKYRLGECEYKWASFRGFGITDRTLYHFAHHS